MNLRDFSIVIVHVLFKFCNHNIFMAEKYSNHDIFHYNVGQSGYITLKHVEMASTNGVSEVASSDVTKAQPSEQVVGMLVLHRH